MSAETVHAKVVSAAVSDTVLGNCSGSSVIVSKLYILGKIMSFRQGLIAIIW